MRSDMFKVIVERPRRGSRVRWSSGDRRYLNSEDAPPKLGMRRGRVVHKWLNENLGPLRKFLARQAGRPWNDVFSEICRTIDNRSTVKQHVRSHIEDFVAIETRLVDGEVCAPTWSGPYTPLRELPEELYVDPLSGVLMRNMERVTYRQKQRERENRRQKELDARLRVLSPLEELHRVHGIWYAVRLAELPKCRKEKRFANGRWHEVTVHEKRWDVLLRKAVFGREPRGPKGEFVRGSFPYRTRGLYAAHKSQLGARELRRYGLR